MIWGKGVSFQSKHQLVRTLTIGDNPNSKKKTKKRERERKRGSRVEGGHKINGSFCLLSSCLGMNFEEHFFIAIYYNKSNPYLIIKRGFTFLNSIIFFFSSNSLGILFLFYFNILRYDGVVYRLVKFKIRLFF